MDGVCEMEIKRDFYLNKLIQHKKNGMVKIITGVRRCGKSYLLSKLFKEHLLSCGVAEDHIVFLALDDYGNKKLQNPDELYAYVKGRVADSNDYYILLDEIQLVDDFESVINGFMHIANADIYITGSNANMLSGELAAIPSFCRATLLRNFAEEGTKSAFIRSIFRSFTPFTEVSSTRRGRCTATTAVCRFACPWKRPRTRQSI